MSQPLLLEGQVDNRDAVIEDLQQQVHDLKRDLRDTQGELSAAKRANVQAVAALKKELSPLYRALQSLFGELDKFDVESFDGRAGGDKWEAVKVRLAPRLREAIDILLIQGTMRRTQLANALKMDYSNCTKNVIGVLIRQGWVVDSGGQLSLKQL